MADIQTYEVDAEFAPIKWDYDILYTDGASEDEIFGLWK
jgi:hypothetical protein